MLNYKKQIERVGMFIGGVVASNYIGKMINYKNEVEAAVLQAERDEKAKVLQESVNGLSNMFSEHVGILKECGKAFSERHNFSYNKEETLSQLKSIQANGNSTLNKFKEIRANTDWDLESTYQDNIELLKIVADLIKKIENETGNNFISSLSDFYQFLENLSLLQHLVLLDIILYLIVIISIINILSVLFGNEIIKYFNLENRYPKLSIFFKVRATLQRYYLIWSVFLLMFVCIFAIIINTASLYLTLT